MTNIKKHLGSNIKYYRTKNGISQAKLAEMVDMATNYLGLIENGKKFPSAEMLERIAFALGKDSTDLFVLEPIEQNWKENILTKIEMLIDIELKTLRKKRKS
jgi:transcriptional regulator with XRE-family HTH domain